MNRKSVRDFQAIAGRRNSQNAQFMGDVVSANADGGHILVNVRGAVMQCAVQPGSVYSYGDKVMVGRVPGSARLVVNSGNQVINQTIIEAQAAGKGGANAAGGSPVTLPATPLVLYAEAVSCEEIAVMWSSTGDNTVSFVIERSSNGIDFLEIATVPVSQTTYNDTGLAESTTYWYRVKAIN